MITALILLAVIATDVAVAILFVTVRRGMLAPRPALDNRRSQEMEELVIRLRAQAEQAVAELNRQKAQLHRMLAEFGRDQQVTEMYAARPAAVGAAPAMATVPTPAPIDSFELEPQNVIRLAAEGLSERAIAGRTGTSVEAVRLMLAMAGNQATA